MNVLIFSGSMDSRPFTVANQLTAHFSKQLVENGFQPQVFNLANAGIPFFEYTGETPPPTVRNMCDTFRQADLQIWLTPLYHGSMTGVMKNCLDWLEMTSKDEKPYLTGKVVALVSWADGTQAMQGINAMDAVAKALRAWVLPFSVPIMKDHLFDQETRMFTTNYQNKFEKLIQLLAEASTLMISRPLPVTGNI